MEIMVYANHRKIIEMKEPSVMASTNLFFGVHWLKRFNQLINTIYFSHFSGC